MVPREQIFKVDEKSFVSVILKAVLPNPLLALDKRFIFENLYLTFPGSEFVAYKQLRLILAKMNLTLD